MRGLIIAVIFGFGIAVGLIAGAAYLARPKYHKPAEQRTSTDDGNGAEKGSDYDALNYEINDSDLDAQWTMAIGGLALLVITLGTLVYTVIATNKNLAFTKQSVDAYVEAERGRVVVLDSALGESGFVDYEVENIGRSAVIILGIRARVELVLLNRVPAPTTGLEADPPRQFMPLASEQRAGSAGMGTNGPFTFAPTENRLTSDQVATVRNGMNSVVMRGILRYSTVTNQPRRYVFTFISKDGRNWAPVPGDGFNRDFVEPREITRRADARPLG